tara:strand:+ start:47 stop:241 length:195 start_codon:yes stop_codon:yes gene_type:complete
VRGPRLNNLERLQMRQLQTPVRLFLVLVPVLHKLVLAVYKRLKKPMRQHNKLLMQHGLLRQTLI